MATDRVDDAEPIGRCCFDSKQAGRPNPNARFIRKSFYEGGMSVDRLGNADVQYLARLHRNEGQNRKPEQLFRGWYVFSAATARSVGWEILPAPTVDNVWHAEIWPGESEGPDAFKQHCLTIAANAVWRERPLMHADEEFLASVSEDL